MGGEKESWEFDSMREAEADGMWHGRRDGLSRSELLRSWLTDDSHPAASPSDVLADFDAGTDAAACLAATFRGVYGEYRDVWAIGYRRGARMAHTELGLAILGLDDADAVDEAEALG